MRRALSWFILNSAHAMTNMQAKYDYCYSVFERCPSTLNQTIKRACVQPVPEPSTLDAAFLQ